MTTDWAAWHAPYDDPASPLSQRLAIVQAHLGRALDEAPLGVVRLVSACAGQGHDVLGVLAVHPRAADVRALLVETDATNVAAARARARGVPGEVVVRQADAGATDSYAGGVPSDVLLLCGVFGNVVDADVERTVCAAPQLCAPGATLIWTRHRRAPDLTPLVRGWVAGAGFTELAFEAPEETWVGVGVARLQGDPPPLQHGLRMFRFAADATGT